MQYSYNIIVDSPCEITADFAKANQLKVLHFTYTEGNGDEGLCGVDDLFVSRTAHEFYEAMRNGAAPQTSQPSQHEFESAFREAIESGIPAVYLAFDSGISGCYEGACMALDRLRTNTVRRTLRCISSTRSFLPRRSTCSCGRQFASAKRECRSSR